MATVCAKYDTPPNKPVTFSAAMMIMAINPVLIRLKKGFIKWINWLGYWKVLAQMSLILITSNNFIP